MGSFEQISVISIPSELGTNPVTSSWPGYMAPHDLNSEHPDSANTLLVAA